MALIRRLVRNTARTLTGSLVNPTDVLDDPQEPGSTIVDRSGNTLVDRSLNTITTR